MLFAAHLPFVASQQPLALHALPAQQITPAPPHGVHVPPVQICVPAAHDVVSPTHFDVVPSQHPVPIYLAALTSQGVELAGEIAVA